MAIMETNTQAIRASATLNARVRLMGGNFNPLTRFPAHGQRKALHANEPPRVRYRFSARTKEGEMRSGFLQASSPEDARRQLERRGLELLDLEEVRSEAPVHVEPKAPLPPSRSRPVSDPWWKRIDWNRFEWSRLLLGLLALALLGGVVRLAVGWLLADRTYHMKFTGQVVFNTRRKLAADFSKRARPTIWLPKPRWFIFSNGRVVHYVEKGKFEDVDRKARVSYQMGAEGSYTIDVEVALAAKPEEAHLSFRAPGFRRATRPVKFQVKDHQFQAQVPKISLAPRATRRGSTGRRSRSQSPRTTSTPTAR